MDKGNIFIAFAHSIVGRIQKNIGTPSTPNWKDQFYVMTDTGDVYFAGKMIGGLIQYENFTMSNGVCTAGMQIDLTNGELISPYFSLGASGSTIAGWTINQYNIFSSNQNSQYVALNSDPNNTYAIWAGHTDASSAPFSVTKDGTLTAVNADISGAIHMGAGSTISWADISEAGSKAYTTANAANTKANSAYTLADGAYEAAGEAYDIATAIAMGEYQGGTFINEHILYSPEIYANYLYIQPKDNTSGHLILQDYTNNEILDIQYYMGTYPMAVFKSTGGIDFISGSGPVSIDNLSATKASFSRNVTFKGTKSYPTEFVRDTLTNIYGTFDFQATSNVLYSGKVDFTYATVTGLNLSNTAVFG